MLPTTKMANFGCPTGQIESYNMNIIPQVKKMPLTIGCRSTDPAEEGTKEPAAKKIKLETCSEQDIAKLADPKLT